MVVPLHLLGVVQRYMPLAYTHLRMDWKGGSTISFWRWSDDHQKKVRNLEVYIILGKLPLATPYG